MLIFLSKAWTWLKKYWWLPVGVVVALICLLAGRSDVARRILNISRSSQNTQRVVSGVIDAEEKERKEANQKKYDEAIASLEKEYQEQNKKLDEKTKKRVKELIERSQENSELFAEEFANEFGLVLNIRKEE